VEIVHGDPGSEHRYSIDPVQMAILWRGENAKTLHVVDVDGVGSGKLENREVIRKMVEAVDIPIQVGGGLREYEEIKSALELGVYRVVIGTAAVNDPPLIERLVKEFGARRVAVAIEGRDGKIRSDGGKREWDLSPVAFARQMKKLGVMRVIYSDIAEDGISKRLNISALKELATAASVRVTAQGGVTGYQDLIRLQELEKYGVDSVIVGKALYQNSFPCQRLWRLNEKELTDLGPTRRL
jgi:phosphoribosylformimino-5-aminoimidazole carboxamide ribotide isomerase